MPSRVRIFLTWLIVTAAAYGFILTRDERGTGMAGSLLMALGLLGGSVSLIVAFAVLIGGAVQSDPRRFGRFLMWIAVAGSFGGLFPVVQYGGAVYRREQEDAKRFVEQRVADAEARLADGQPWPQTQEQFIAGHPLPRMLRGKRFYRYQGPDVQFEVIIPVDFDGGWIYSAQRRTWSRST